MCLTLSSHCRMSNHLPTRQLFSLSQRVQAKGCSQGPGATFRRSLVTDVQALKNTLKSSRFNKKGTARSHILSEKLCGEPVASQPQGVLRILRPLTLFTTLPSQMTSYRCCRRSLHNIHHATFLTIALVRGFYQPKSTISSVRSGISSWNQTIASIEHFLSRWFKDHPSSWYLYL
jgi:hypothetical protein